MPTLYPETRHPLARTGTEGFPKKTKKNILPILPLLALLALGLQATWAQTAPGGESSELFLWLKADDNGTTTTDGASLSPWVDRSGNGYNFTNSATASNTFVPNAPEYSAIGLNFNPTVDFSDPTNEDALVYTAFPAPLANNRNLDMYIVADGSGGAVPFFSKASNNAIDFQVKAELSIFNGGNVTGLSTSKTGKAIYAVRRAPQSSSTPPNTDFSIRFNGSEEGTGAIATSISSRTSLVLGGRGTGDTSIGGTFTGTISEVIIYDFANGSGSFPDQNKIESYLALKYGLTLDQSTVSSNDGTGDYVLSDGTVVFDAHDGASVNAYNKDIFGIGNDSGSALDQKVSQSSSDGAILTVATTNDFSSANSDGTRTSLTDGQFLVMGHNGENNLSLTPLSGVASYDARSQRVWRVKNTGSVGNVHLKFDGHNADWALLVDADGDFSAGATAYPLNANGELSSALTLPDGHYLTLATNFSAPAGIMADLELWLRADAGISESGGIISYWADQSGNILDANALGNPAIADNAANFNPGVRMDRADGVDYIEANVSSTNARSVFLVFNMAMTSSVWRTPLDLQPNLQRNVFRRHDGTDFFADPTNANDREFGTDFRLEGRDIMDINFSTEPINFGTIRLGYAKESAAPFAFTTYSVGSRGTGTTGYTGDVMEAIIFSSVLTTAQALEIESYLALKYGISLDQTAPQNYVASDGSTLMWNAATAATSGFTNNIFGIGMDADSGLDQRVSKSSNSDGILTMATTNDFSSANTDSGRTSLTDLNFQTVAHNNGTNTWDTANAPYSYALLDREWQVQETGTVGTVHFTFDVGDADFDVPDLDLGTTTYFIVVDDENDGDYSDDTPIALTNSSGTLWSGSVDFTAGSRFTLATRTAGILLSQNASAVTEGGSNTTYTLTMAVEPTHNVNVALSLDNGEVTLGQSNFIFSTSNWATPRTVTVNPFDDLLIDGETTTLISVAVTSSDTRYQGLPVEDHTVTISDNDTATVSIAAGDNGAEGGVDATFTVSLGGGLTNGTGAPITGDISFDDAADLDTPPTTYSIADGESEATITLTIADDALIEGSEMLEGEIEAPAGGALGTATADVGITDNDLLTVEFSAPDFAGGDEDTDITPSILVGGGVSTVAATVQITLADGAANGATAGDDYTAGSITVTIPADDYSSAQTVSADGPIAILQDMLVEADETIDLAFGTLALAQPGDANGADGEQNTATATIMDDDTPTVSIAAGDNGAEGGANATFTVSLDGGLVNATGAPITGTVTFNDAADLDTPPTTYSIADGESDATITLAIEDDALIEGTESLGATIEAPAGGAQGTPTAMVDITDNDAITVSIAAGNNGAEGGAPATFTVSLDGALVNATGAPITGTLTFNDAADLDTPPTGYSIPDGDSDATVSATVLDDALVEGTEMLEAEIGAPAGGTVGTATAMVDITDNDGLTVAFNSATFSSGETGDLEIVLDVSGAVVPADESIAINVTGGTATGGGTDYTLAAPLTVPILAGDYTGGSTITRNIAVATDNIAEGDETIELALQSPSANVSPGAQDTATATITDDDDDDNLMLAVTASDPEVDESGSDTGTFTIEIDHVLTVDLLVNFTVGGTATITADYQGLGTQATIPAGSTSVEVDVVLDGNHTDSEIEGDETVVLTLSGGTPSGGALPPGMGVAVGAMNAATVTIIDDDSAGILLAGVPTDIDEDGGSATFTVRLSTMPASPVVLDIASGDTAEATVGTVSLSFDATDWNTPKSVAIDAVDDALVADHGVNMNITVDDGASDDDYDGLSRNFVVALTDDDFALAAIADIEVAENDTYTSVVPSVAAGSPTGTLSYALGGDDAGAFTIDTATGEVQMVARDFEAPVDADGDNGYQVSVTATDTDGDSATEAWTVTVADVTETATFTVAQADGTVDENDTYNSLAPTLGGDAPIGEVTYALEPVIDFDDLSIDPATGTVTLAGPDFENPTDSNMNGQYGYRIRATDADGNTALSEIVDITVGNVQETATLTVAQADGTAPENTVYNSTVPTLGGDAPIGEVTYALEPGIDAGELSIDTATGIVTLTDPDFEAPADSDTDNRYGYRIRATDADGNTALSEIVEITVENVQEAASFAIGPIDDAQVDEGTPYTGPLPQITGTPGGALQYSLGGADAAAFAIDPDTGAVAMAARDFEAPADADSDNVYELAITAGDADGNTASEDWSVTVINIPDMPGFALGESSLDIDEDGGQGTFTAVLADRPLADVVLLLQVDDAGQATVAPQSITFTPDDWDVPVTVTVTGIDDNDTGDDTATITVSVDAANSDDAFDALAGQQVALTLINDDTADVSAIVDAADDPADGDPSLAELIDLGINVPTGLSQQQIEEAIAKADPAPATVAELQQLVDALEQEVIAVGGLVFTAGDPADGTPSIAEIEELGIVVPEGLSQEEIEEAIANADPVPTTVDELQELIDGLTTGGSVEELVGGATDPASGSPSIAELEELGINVPGGLDQEDIEEAIAGADPAPTSVDELQELIDMLGIEVEQVTELTEGATDPASGSPSIAELEQIGITVPEGLTQEQVEEAIANADPVPTTTDELQELIDALDREVEEVATVTEGATDPASGSPSIAELEQIGIDVPAGLSQQEIEEAIANADPAPATLQELQELIDALAGVSATAEAVRPANDLMAPDINGGALIIDNIQDFPDNTVEIFNRWGNPVFKIQGYDNTGRVFRGIADGKGSVLPGGVYFYVIRFMDGEVQRSRTGYIYINQ